MKIVDVSYNFYDSSIMIVIDVNETSKISIDHHDFMNKLASHLKKKFKEKGIEFKVEVEDTAYPPYIRIPGISAVSYGFIHRLVEEYSSKYLQSAGSYITHMLTLYVSEQKFPDIIYLAEYTVKNIPKNLPKHIRFKILGEICRNLTQKEVPSTIYTKFSIVCLSEDKNIFPQTLNAEAYGTLYMLELKRRFKVDYQNRVHRQILTKIISALIRFEAIKRKLKAHGREILFPTPIFEDERLSVARGIEYQVLLLEDNHIGLAVSPIHHVHSSKSLWEEFDRERRRLLESSQSLRGKVVRRKYDWKTLSVLEILDLDYQAKINFETIGKLYKNLGLRLGIDYFEDEPVVKCTLRGRSYLELPSQLIRVYTMSDLKELGLSTKISRITRIRAERIKEYLSGWVKRITPITLPWGTMTFTPEPLEVEYL